MKARYFLLVGIVIALCIGGYFFYFNRSITHTASLIEGYLIPPIEYKGETYTVKNGRVVERVLPHDEARIQKIAYYALAARIDPIFGFPGMDLEVYDRVLKSVMASRDEIARLFEDEAQTVNETIYPVAYLELLGELEEERRELTSSPSGASAERYHQKLVATVGAYQSYIDVVRSAQDEVERRGRLWTKVQYHTGYSSPAYIHRIFEVYRDAARLSLQKEDLRYACLKLARDCDTPHPMWREFSAGSNIATSSLPQEVLDNYTILSVLRDDVYNGTSTDPEIAVLGGSSCVLSYAPAYYYLWWRFEKNDLATFRPGIINDIGFYDFENGPQATWQYAQNLIARGGGPYAYQPIANHYVCPDLASDLGDLQSALFAREQFSIIHDALNAVGHATSGDTRERLDDIVGGMSSVLSSQQIIDERQTDQVVAHLVALFDAHSEEELAEIVGMSLVVDLESLLLTYMLDTLAYEEAVMNVIGNNRAVAEFWEAGVRTPLEEILYVRNVPKVLLGGFNRSIVPIDIALLEVPSRTLSPELRTYSSVADRYMPSVFSDLLKRSALIELDIISDTMRDY